MPDELPWFLFAVVALAGLFPLVRHLRHRPALAGCVMAAAVAAVGLSARYRDRQLTRRGDEQARFLAAVPREGRPGGYVGSDQCRACHPGPYDSWHHSFHRTMTTRASPETIRAPFDGRTLEWNGRQFRVERRGDEFWAEMPDPDQPPARPGNSETPALAWKRLTLVTGSHAMQAFWAAGRNGNLQHAFPFAWLIGEQKWVPARDTFLRDPAKSQPDQHWNQNCASCHATAGQPRQDPRTGAFDTRAGELGIACEACHGPGEEHAERQRNPLRRAQARLRPGTDTTIVNPARQEHRASAQICGQCHGIKWVPAAENYNVEGYSFRPGSDLDRSTPIVRPARLDLQPFLREPLRRNPAFVDEHYWPDGEVRVSGREFNGVVDSPCFERGKLSCLSCHSMHGYVDRDDQLAPGRGANDACLQCHEAFREHPEAHTHHPANSPGSLCYNCHMPHTTYGLMKSIRSHRISNPSVDVSVRTGRPNACNLCHLDRSLAWTAESLTAWYRQPAIQVEGELRERSAAMLWLLRGDAGQRALMAWHMGWEPARAASGERWLAPGLAQLLVDPYATVRFIAHRSLRRLPGFADFEFEYTAPESARALARDQALERWRSHPGGAPERTGPSVFLDSDGGFDAAAAERALARRDNRSMDLQE